MPTARALANQPHARRHHEIQSDQTYSLSYFPERHYCDHLGANAVLRQRRQTSPLVSCRPFRIHLLRRGSRIPARFPTAPPSEAISQAPRQQQQKRHRKGYVHTHGRPLSRQRLPAREPPLATSPATRRTLQECRLRGFHDPPTPQMRSAIRHFDVQLKIRWMLDSHLTPSNSHALGNRVPLHTKARQRVRPPLVSDRQGFPRLSSTRHTRQRLPSIPTSLAQVANCALLFSLRSRP